MTQVAHIRIDAMSTPAKRPTAKRKASQANTLLAQFLAVEENGRLAQHVREVVAGNLRKAAQARKTSACAAPVLRMRIS